MTYANQSTQTSPNALMARLQNLRSIVADALRQRAVYNQTVRELQALSDRELADLGIHRSEIARIAAQAAREA